MPSLNQYRHHDLDLMTAPRTRLPWHMHLLNQDRFQLPATRLFPLTPRRVLALHALGAGQFRTWNDPDWLIIIYVQFRPEIIPLGKPEETIVPGVA